MNLGRRQVGDDIDAAKQVACKFFEVLDLADAIHLFDDFIEDGFDFFVRLFREKRALAFEAALVPQKFLSIEIGDVFPSSFFSFHIFSAGWNAHTHWVRNIQLSCSTDKFLSKNVIYGLRIRSTSG